MSYIVRLSFSSEEFKMTEKSITFRIEEKTKETFEKIAERLDITPSQLLRSFVRDFVEKNKARAK